MMDEAACQAWTASPVSHAAELAPQQPRFVILHFCLPFLLDKHGRTRCPAWSMMACK